MCRNLRPKRQPQQSNTTNFGLQFSDGFSCGRYFRPDVYRAHSMRRGGLKMGMGVRGWRPFVRHLAANVSLSLSQTSRVRQGQCWSGQDAWLAGAIVQSLWHHHSCPAANSSGAEMDQMDNDNELQWSRMSLLFLSLSNWSETNQEQHYDDGELANKRL